MSADTHLKQHAEIASSEATDLQFARIERILVSLDRQGSPGVLDKAVMLARFFRARLELFPHRHGTDGFFVAAFEKRK